MIKDILTITKKELKSCFSDKMILVQIVLLPFIIVSGYAMLMSTMAESGVETENSDYTAYCVNTPEYMTDVFSELGINSTELDIDTIKNQISEKKCDLLVVFPDDFAIAETAETELSDVQIWYNSENTDSSTIYNMTVEILNAFQPKAFTINSDADINYDYGDENYLVKKMLGTLLPTMILMSVFMVCMNLAAESVAGDKERGFLNTMLITPVKRSSIAAGKSLCVFIAAIIGGISAFLGMAGSLPKMAKSTGATESISYSFSEYLLLFGVTITAVFALAGILLVLSTLAKDVKQATTIAPVFMMILMIASMLTMVESFGETVDKLGMINACIPAWNTMVVMQDIIVCDYSSTFVIITCAVNVVFSAIAVFVVGRLFENERIVNA